MGTTGIKIICYADNALLVAEKETDLKGLFFHFETACKKYNTIISTQKSKTMTTAKEPLRCKLFLNGKTI
jgi:hypothetical protein